jgi:RimJ/RimL family protein N-acetyltransferase
MEDPECTFAIEWEGKFAGVCGLNLKTDIYRNTCEVGYWIAEPFWSKGIATKAVELITNYAFQKLDKKRLHAGVFEYNKASMRVLEKCGYEREGVFKNALTKDGKLYNEVRYARVK